MASPVRKLKVIFEPNLENNNTSVSDALLTQFMVTVSRVALRTDKLDNNVIIKKDKKYENKEN